MEEKPRPPRRRPTHTHTHTRSQSRSRRPHTHSHTHALAQDSRMDFASTLREVVEETAEEREAAIARAHAQEVRVEEMMRARKTRRGEDDGRGKGHKPSKERDAQHQAWEEEIARAEQVRLRMGKGSTGRDSDSEYDDEYDNPLAPYHVYNPPETSTYGGIEAVAGWISPIADRRKRRRRRERAKAAGTVSPGLEAALRIEARRGVVGRVRKEYDAGLTRGAGDDETLARVSELEAVVEKGKAENKMLRETVGEAEDELETAARTIMDLRAQVSRLKGELKSSRRGADPQSVTSLLQHAPSSPTASVNLEAEQRRRAQAEKRADELKDALETMKDRLVDTTIALREMEARVADQGRMEVAVEVPQQRVLCSRCKRALSEERGDESDNDGMGVGLSYDPYARPPRPLSDLPTPDTSVSRGPPPLGSTFTASALNGHHSSSSSTLASGLPRGGDLNASMDSMASMSSMVSARTATEVVRMEAKLESSLMQLEASRAGAQALEIENARLHQQLSELSRAMDTKTREEIHTRIRMEQATAGAASAKAKDAEISHLLSSNRDLTRDLDLLRAKHTSTLERLARKDQGLRAVTQQLQVLRSQLLS